LHHTVDRTLALWVAFILCSDYNTT